MDDARREIDDLRLDVQTLRTLIDLALERGVSGDDVTLRALANVLHDRRTRLEALERALSIQETDTAPEESPRGPSAA